VANFRIPELRERFSFPQPIKLVIHGGSAYEINVTLAAVFRHRRVESVLYGMDPTSFQVAPTATGLPWLTTRFPEYLYEDGISGHIRYLATIKTFKRSISALKNSRLKRGDVLFSYDRMYESQHLRANNFGGKSILRSWREQKIKLRSLPRYDLNNFIDSFESNVLPHLRRNRDTDFMLLHLPYSILKYEQMAMLGNLTDYQEFKKYVYSATKELGNVRLYDFQVAKEITHDLANYRDLSHFHQRINTWMLEQIAADRYRVNAETVERYHAELLAQVEDFDHTLVVPDAAQP
jgi:hypothetical protein